MIKPLLTQSEFTGAAFRTFCEKCFHSKAMGFTLLFLLFSSGVNLSAQNAKLSTGNIVACDATIRDGGGTGNYQDNRNEWITIAGVPGATITISGSWGLETCCDRIFIRNGYGNAGTALYTSPGTGTTGAVNYLGTAGQTLTVHLTSDGSVRSSGFQFTVTYSVAQTCPTYTSVAGQAQTVACGSNTVLKDHKTDGNYGNNRNDFIVLNGATGSTSVLNLTGHYNTESNYDYVRVYQGSGTGGTLVYGALSGSGIFNFTGSAGVTYTLQFTSDGNTVAGGFSLFASYTGSCVACTTPTAYSVTGGGSYCAGGSGVTIGLGGSQTGVNYQLFNGASAIGASVVGTGSALSWANITGGSGSYTVQATGVTGYCTSPLVAMTGSASVTANPSPSTPNNITGTTTIACGSQTTLNSADPASGGTLTISGSAASPSSYYNIRTFTTSGTFTTSPSPLIVDVLVVAGGGGGGQNGGGGGGGGGLLYSSPFTASGGSIPVSVGNGGTPGVNASSGGSPGANGGNSIFSTLTAIGGGGGANRDFGGASTSGGSGGGGGGGTWTAAAAGTVGQGNTSGTGFNSGCPSAGGGGGGAGAVGTAGASNASGNGGNGVANSISGASVFYAGGGGGGPTCAPGTFGTGGLGGANGGTSASANTGGGGGGNNGTGGSGVVIVRYPKGVWSSDAPAVASVNATTGVVTGNTAGTTTIRHTVTGGGSCTSQVSSSFTVNSCSPPTISSFTAAACAGSGASISINGTNFVGSNSVIVNGQSATFTVNSATLITATLPNAATGTGSIVVTTPSGSYSSASIPSTFTVTPLPVITGNPTTLAICENGGGTFTASTSASSPTYLWEYGTSSSGPWVTTVGVTGLSGQTSNTLTLSNIPAGYNGVYVRCMVTSSGCSTASASALLTVVTNPTGGSIAATSFCSGSSTTVSVTGVSNATQYTWSLPGLLGGSSTTSSIGVSGSTAGSYSVSVTPQNVSGALTCSCCICCYRNGYGCCHTLGSWNGDRNECFVRSANT